LWKNIRRKNNLRTKLSASSYFFKMPMTQLSKDPDEKPCCCQAFLKSGCLSLPDTKAHFIFWFIFVFGLLLDLWSKKAVFSWLSDNGSFTIIDGFLKIVTAENIGAAFGIAAGKRFLLVATSIIALVGVVAVFLFGTSKQRLVQTALALFAAGVSGNLYDRLFNDGRVRDFIDVVYWPGRHWPAFNLADSMLCISVGLLIISTLRTPKQPHAEPQP
jgi:signal peptidase II